MIGSNQKEGEDRFESILNIHTYIPFPDSHTSFLFGTVQLTSQEKLGICPPSKVKPMHYITFMTCRAQPVSCEFITEDMLIWEYRS